MAVLNKKEEKIQAVLGRLPKNYSQDDFVKMFIQLFSNDWGKIKRTYIKQSQDKEEGTVFNMPKPELYLKQMLDIYLSKPTANSDKSTKVEQTEKAETKVTTKAPKLTKATKTTVTKTESKVVEKATKADIAPQAKTIKTNSTKAKKVKEDVDIAPKESAKLVETDKKTVKKSTKSKSE